MNIHNIEQIKYDRTAPNSFPVVSSENARNSLFHIPRLSLGLALIVCAVAGKSRAEVVDAIFDGGFEPSPLPSTVITLTPNATLAASELVTLGIPFPPGTLNDAGRVRVLDDGGNEVGAFVRATLRWHWMDNSIRAVKVQFFADPDASYRFDISAPRTQSIAEQPYDNGTRPGTQGAPVPRVLATLDKAWLSESGIAGPQAPYDTERDYDRYVDRQWQWASTTPYSGVHGFLFDRASVVGFQYIRNGRPDFFAEFYNSATFYLSKIKTTGSCAGGWEHDGVSPCDTKYVYITPHLLLIALAGDDTRVTPATVELMAQHQIQNTLRPYNGGSQWWTERHTGLALTHVVSSYEITADADTRDSLDEAITWLYDHQQTPPGDPFTGAWTHSWQIHEGLGYNPGTDVRGGSPWMSANIIGGLWRAWRVTNDPRIPVMIRDFGRYMEQYGFVSEAGFAAGGSDWRSSCNADGTIAWYFSSGIAPLAAVAAIQNDQGWGSDAHNPELLMVVAAARYFETDPTWRQTFAERAARVSIWFNQSCAAASHTPRAFNWQHRNPEAVWLLDQ